MRRVGVLRKVRVCNFSLKMGLNDRQMETFWKHWAAAPQARIQTSRANLLENRVLHWWAVLDLNQ